MSTLVKRALGVLPLLAVAGCMPLGDLVTQSGLYEDKQANFQAVAVKSMAVTGKRAAWLHTAEAARQTSQEVRAMVHRKTISADTAVQVALLNNKGLQAAYADIGIDAADVWQQILPENPVVSVGVLGIAAPEVVLFRALEAMITTNLQAMMTRERASSQHNNAASNVPGWAGPVLEGAKRPTSISSLASRSGLASIPDAGFPGSFRPSDRVPRTSHLVADPPALADGFLRRRLARRPAASHPQLLQVRGDAALRRSPARRNPGTTPRPRSGSSSTPQTSRRCCRRNGSARTYSSCCCLWCT